MKKKIAILGSTGSIGKNTINVFKKDKKNFKIFILSTNKNVKTLIKQAKEFKVKYLIINDYDEFIKARKIYKNTSFKFYNNFHCLDKILNKNKLYYAMISLVGIDGLYPTLKIIKYCKNVAIANKESLICAWNLIKKELFKYSTNFIPVDSEHFSIFCLTKNLDTANIKKIYITASGGPFLNHRISDFKNITLNQSLKHPSWKMGKKITVDSSTLMNKVFEVIEAKNIFNISFKKISILTHPNSYLHAIVQLYDGTFRILLHNPDMKIPIRNSIYFRDNNYPKFISSKLNLKLLNNLNLNFVDAKKFPLVKLLKNFNDNSSQYATVLITINDYFVSKFLEKKINYLKLVKLIESQANRKIFLRFKKNSVKNIDDIKNIRKYVYSKLQSLGI